MLTGPARRERSRRTVPRRTCRWRNERVCSRSSHTSIASTFVQAQQKTRIGAWVFNRQSLPSNLDNSSRPRSTSRSIPAVIPLNRSASSASSSAIAIGSGHKLDWIVSTKVLKRLPYTSPRLCSHPAADAKARAVGGQAEAEHQQAASRAQGLSVSSAWQGDRPPNQVWAADITYIAMRQGFLYLVAIILFILSALLLQICIDDSLCFGKSSSRSEPHSTIDAAMEKQAL
jgi:hypothetical protein